MRPLLILAVALLAWALAAPARAPQSLVAAMTPQLGGVAVVRTRSALHASWRPVAGQALVCAYRYRPLPQEALEPCLVGAGGSLALAVARDVGLQVVAGDVVELRAYDRRGALLALGRVEVAGAWRVWLPVVGRS